MGLAREADVEKPMLLNKLLKLTTRYYTSRYPVATRKS